LALSGLLLLAREPFGLDVTRRYCQIGKYECGGSGSRMGRNRDYDLKSMDAAALRVLIARCERRVRGLRGPYAKARREWAALGDRAKAELARRG
jgi:hypothetical protein